MHNRTDPFCSSQINENCELHYLQFAIGYIIVNFKDDITEIDIAKPTGTCKRNLRRIFRRYIDMTPCQLLRLYRIYHAEYLLTDFSSKTSVKQVAYNCGFNDPLYFTKVFKKYSNQSPSIFRDRIVPRALHPEVRILAGFSNVFPCFEEYDCKIYFND